MVVGAQDAAVASPACMQRLSWSRLRSSTVPNVLILMAEVSTKRRLRAPLDRIGGAPGY
jgi:hypothetical protein